MSRTFEISTSLCGQSVIVATLRHQGGYPTTSVLALPLARRIVPMICKAHAIRDSFDLLRVPGSTHLGNPDSINPHSFDPNWRAMGAHPNSCHGDGICAYVRTDSRGDSTLTRWTGETILDARSYVAGDYRTEDGDKSHALAFRLPRDRWIVGLSLGSGMLFRGRLVEARGIDEARPLARDEAESWLRIDSDAREEKDKDNVDLEPIADDPDSIRAPGELASPRVLRVCGEIGAECGLDWSAVYLIVRRISTARHDFSGDVSEESEDYTAARALQSLVTSEDIPCSNG